MIFVIRKDTRKIMWSFSCILLFIDSCNASMISFKMMVILSLLSDLIAIIKSSSQFLKVSRNWFFTAFSFWFMYTDSAGMTRFLPTTILYSMAFNASLYEAGILSMLPYILPIPTVSDIPISLFTCPMIFSHFSFKMPFDIFFPQISSPILSPRLNTYVL